MDSFINKRIAVIGVSANPAKFAHKIYKDLKAKGVIVSGVHPLGIDVLGDRMYKSLSEISPVPEIVITVVPSSITEKIVLECVKLGIKEIWMQPGSESQTAILNAQSQGIKVTSNACFMVGQGIW